MLTLLTIRFNHDHGSATTSAMNIRRNRDFEVQFPEYDSALPTQDSRAAYGIAETAGQKVVVRVEISSTSAGKFEVKAKGGGVLGRLDPFTVSFNAPGTVTVDVRLNHRSFDAVSRSDTSWSWAFRAAGAAAWTPLVRTRHRIYLLLAVPGAPWTQTYADKRNPWTDLLDFVCAIASGKKMQDRATFAVVRAIHQDFSLRYDIVNGAARYGFGGTSGSFMLMEWIDYVLKGNAPASPLWCDSAAEQYKRWWIVNCYDCAAALTIMSTALGAAVVHHYHSPFGKLRFIEAIGRGKCNNPFPGCTGTPTEVGNCNRTSFGNHAYTKLDSLNFDACMREWISPFMRLLLIFLWLIILIITFGTVNLEALLDRAGGWLVRLSQPTYDDRTIDSACSPTTGAPIVVNTQFSA